MRGLVKFFLLAAIMAAGVFFCVALLRPGGPEEGSRQSVLRTVYQMFQGAHPERGLTVVPDAVKTAEPTAEERAVKAELEEMLLSREPAYRLTRAGSGPLEGNILEESADHVVFSQKYGDSAELKLNIPRAEIASLEKLPLPERTDISACDVRFYREFPQLFFFKARPYTVMSQESYFAIQRMIQEQQRLYSELTGFFGGLIGTSTNLSDIQILVFSDKDLYDRYVAVRAPEFKGYSGLYTPRENRLITYHQRDSQWVEEGSKKIDEMAKQYREKKLDSRNEANLRQWQVIEKNKLRGAAQQATDRTMRHEGAHQLFFCLGIQNPRQQGRLWVTEGLATFCEPDKIGRLNPERIQSLKEAAAQNRLVSLGGLLSAAEMPDTQKYAEAWSFTHFLMQPEYRPRFFDYLRWLRDHPNGPVKDPAGELTVFLKTDVVQLEIAWKAYVTKILQ